jgi:hypothetical protein
MPYPYHMIWEDLTIHEDREMVLERIRDATSKKLKDATTKQFKRSALHAYWLSRAKSHEQDIEEVLSRLLCYTCAVE